MESEDEFAYERADDYSDFSGDDSNRGGRQQSGEDSNRGGRQHSEDEARHELEHAHEYQGRETRGSSAVDAVDDAVTSPGFGRDDSHEHAQASSNARHDYVGRAGGELAQPSARATAAPFLVSITGGLPPRSPVLHAQRQRPHRQESAAHDHVVDDVEL
jgi:hypothetical protein